jgi:imidazolonepropionase-like amidohydrolase
VSNANVIDIVDGKVTQSQDIFISEGVITKIVDHEARDYEAGQIVDASDLYVIPGLWDMHVHAIQDADYKYALPMNVANGITGIRDMFGNLRLRDSLRTLNTVGGLPIPRMEVGGGVLGGNPARNGTSVATVEEAIEYVEILANNGADFIKTYEYLKPDIYRAIMEKSSELGLPVYGHPPKLLGLSEAMELGQRSFEHLSQIPFYSTPYTDSIITDMYNHWYGPDIPLTSKQFDSLLLENYDESVVESLAKEMARKESFFCPTIMVYANLSSPWKAEIANKESFNYLNPFRQWFWNDDISWAKETFLKDSIGFRAKFENRKNILSIFIKNDVPIVAGTDAGVAMHGFDLHNELKYYVEAGMTPLEAIQSATLKPAELLGKTESIGRVEAGYAADLVLLRLNPLKDINNTRSIDGVILNGIYKNEATIDSALLVIKERYGKAVLDTLTQVLKSKGAEAVIELATNWKDQPERYYLGGGQLTILGYNEWRNGRLDKAKLLLKEEIRINPLNAEFASSSLVELMGELYGIDSAQVESKRHLTNFGFVRDVQMISVLRRIVDSTYGQPNYIQIDSLSVKLLEGTYYTDEGNDKLELLWQNDSFKININDRLGELSAVNDTVFYVMGNEPERIVIRTSDKNDKTIYYIAGRNTMKFEK